MYRPKLAQQDSLLSGADSSGTGVVDGGDAGGGGDRGGGGGVPGGYRHGVFVRAARGSSIDVGLFHDDQRRSVATLEVWVNAGEKVRAGKFGSFPLFYGVFSRGEGRRGEGRGRERRDEREGKGRVIYREHHSV